jgi:hypothetical protein
MIVFDFLTGQLKFVQPSSPDADSSNGFVDFGDRQGGDVTLDTGDRMNTDALIDLQSRV